MSRNIRRGKLAETWALLAAALPGREDANPTASATSPTALEFLFRATQLVAQYGEVARARRWVAVQRSRARAQGATEPVVATAFDLVEFGIAWVSRDAEQIQRHLATVDWESCDTSAWAANLRLAVAMGTNRDAEVQALVCASNRADSRHRESLRQGTKEEDKEAVPSFDYHRGNRQRLLGFFYFERGELRRSLRYFRSAHREFSPDESIDARLKLVEIYGHWGKAAFREGQFEASARFLKKAVRHAAAFRHTLWEDTFRIELAYVRAHQGQFARARRTIHPVLRPRQEEPGSTGARSFLQVKALLAAAHIAADEGLRERATRYARRGRKLFMASPDERLRPHLRLLYGRIAALTPTLADRAAHHFTQAERGFLAFGDGDLPGLSLLAYYRGLLHVKRRDTRAALAEACRSLDLAKRHGFLPARSASLLLKSQLLLQEEVPGADRLYEEVLRDLGSVEDRVVLFKVIANLYLYSWELNEHLELTDSHLRQIHRMADLLDEETFRCLYQRYVALPVARRTLARAFGIHPEELGPQEG